MARLKELNSSNRKKEDSFHADRPRKTRGGLKYTNAVNALKSQPRSKPIKVEKTSPKVSGVLRVTNADAFNSFSLSLN